MNLATIQPTVPHVALAASAVAAVRAEGVAGAIAPEAGFCSALTDAELERVADEQTHAAARALVHAAHARELLAARRAPAHV